MNDFLLIIEKIRAFRDDRDWMQFHHPKDMAAGIAIEAAELMEIFLWKNEEENAYLEGLNSIINYGIERNDRTGVGTFSIFGMRWQYDLTDTFPILTTKRMFFRGIYAELALYISMVIFPVQLSKLRNLFHLLSILR